MVHSAFAEARMDRNRRSRQLGIPTESIKSSASDGLKGEDVRNYEPKGVTFDVPTQRTRVACYGGSIKVFANK